MVTDSLHLPTLIFWGWFFCTKKRQNTQKTKKWPIKYYFYRYSDNPVIVNSFGQDNHAVKSDIVTARPASRRFLTSGNFHEDERGLNVHGSNKRASRPEPATGPSRGQRLQQQRCTRAVHLVTQQTQRASLTSLVLLSFQTWISSKQTQTHRSSDDDSLIPVTLYNSQTAAQFSSLIWDQTHLCIFNVCCAS